MRITARSPLESMLLGSLITLCLMALTRCAINSHTRRLIMPNQSSAALRRAQKLGGPRATGQLQFLYEEDWPGRSQGQVGSPHCKKMIFSNVRGCLGHNVFATLHSPRPVRFTPIQARLNRAYGFPRLSCGLWPEESQNLQRSLPTGSLQAAPQPLLLTRS